MRQACPLTMHLAATHELPGLMTPARQPDAFARLTPLGWSGGLALITALLAASFFLAGYFLIYWRNADMDFMVVYSALAMNDGLPQHYVDHTAHLTIVSAQYW